MSFCRNWLAAVLTLTATLFMIPAIGAAGGPRVAVLPFNMHAQEPVEDLRARVQEILTSKIEERGYDVIDSAEVNRHPLAFRPRLDDNRLLELGQDLEAQWVLAGSATRIGKRISLDIKVLDVSRKRRPFFVYGTAEDLEALPNAAEQISASVDYRISGVQQVDLVRISGNQRIESDAILANVETEKGDRLDYDRLDQDLRRIFKMGYFRDVKVETEDGVQGKVVTFEVTEKPSIGQIVFEGNEALDDEKLKEELGIKLYSILDRQEVKKGMERLEAFYRQEGYYNVDIRSRTEPLPKNEVLLAYDIEENEKVYIEEIEFVGNSHFDDDELKDVMETSEKGMLSWLTDSGVLDRKKLEFDVQKLVGFYHNHGFIKAKIGEPQVSYLEEEGLKVAIDVEEGPQYGVEDLSVEGDLIKPEEELVKGLKIREEDVFNRETVRADVQRLRDIYANEGYAYAEIDPVTEEKPDRHAVDITYQISKGEKVKFERINITGNTKTRDKVIRRELKVVEGNYFSGKALKRSSQNLQRLGFFQDVQVQTKKGSQEDRMILDLNVTERPTGTLSFGAGYSSVDEAIGMLQVSQKNLLGYGQELVGSVRVGSKSSEYDISFEEPWLFDRPISGRVHAFNWEREYDDYTKDALGGDLTLGFRLEKIDEFTRFWTRYRYADSEITDVDSDAATVIKEMEGRSVTSSMTFGIRRNSTDRWWNPTTGSINSLSFEYAGGVLGGDNYFNEYSALTTWFFPLPWDTVFMVRGKGGYLESRSGGDLPVYERYYLGGINSVRGFEHADISPIDPESGDRVGGDTMFVYNMEYRFPLLEEQGVEGLVFFDAGNVYSSESDVIERDLAMSVGAGIRWYSPMGPLRLEWGYNLDRKKEDPWEEPSSNVEFSVGAVF